MTIEEQQLQMLAELRDMPSYRLLMGLFKDFEDTVMGSVAVAKDERELVRVSRFFQVVHAMRVVLETHPENAFQQLETLRTAHILNDIDPATIPTDLIHKFRFNPDETTN